MARPRVQKRVLVVSIQIVVWLLHFVTGQHYTGPYPVFVNGYLIDILLPFAVYFLLCLMAENVFWLRPAYVKAIGVVGFGACVELSQYFDFPIFGSTFDPLDMVAYAGGVTLALLCDVILFPRLFGFWVQSDQS